jgi:hypothetical protein
MSACLHTITSSSLIARVFASAIPIAAACQIAKGEHYRADPTGKRTGNGVSPQLMETMERVCQVLNFQRKRLFTTASLTLCSQGRATTSMQCIFMMQTAMLEQLVAVATAALTRSYANTLRCVNVYGIAYTNRCCSAVWLATAGNCTGLCSTSVACCSSF